MNAKSNPQKRFRLRTWSTPLTVGAFVLTAGTGLGLFFGLHGGLVQVLHEWLSLAFVLGGLLHFLDHWKSVQVHWRRLRGKALMLAGVAALVIAFVPLGGDAPGGRVSPQATIQTLARVPLPALAEARHEPLTDLKARLEAAGIDMGDGTGSLAEAVGSDRARLNQALAAVLSSPAPTSAPN
ncbi:MAG: hypothetical protein EP329_03990 [Deltaproteobacteria bacterium]|nr:MAG: hypothetical protein EP329_03990 [Deltaproteobacteria bacterium]